MKILAVFCHPNRHSLTGAVLDSFVSGSRAAGHEVEIADLYREGFDPLLSERDLEQFDGVAMPEDVLAQQARVERCDALCLVFPLWWWGMPAMLKGWLDRVWSAGWAYEADDDPEGTLLDPRTCVILCPAGASQRMLDKYQYDKAIDNIWRFGTLDYCGMTDRRIHLMLNANRPGMGEAHLQTAYRAGLDIALPKGN